VVTARLLNDTFECPLLAHRPRLPHQATAVVGAV